MKVKESTYVELVHSMLMSVAMEQLSIGQVAMLLHSCAQETATESIIDITCDVRDALDDWSEEHKGMLIAVDVVHIVFLCDARHDKENPCPKGHHTVQMTRVIGSPGGFRPEDVHSRHKFNDTVVRLSLAHHPDGGNLQLAGTLSVDSGLADAFNRVMGEQTIDAKVDDFRAELDKLFPSIPTHRKEEGDEPS